MPQEDLPPGYEIVSGDQDLFVKKDGQYVMLHSERKRSWSKKSEKVAYQWCWRAYRREANLPFEDYANIVQIIPAQPSWEAVHLDDRKEDLFDTVPIACWAQVEIFDGPYKRTHVVGVIANENTDEKHVLTLIGENDLSFLGYTYPGNETDWKHEAYQCIKMNPGVSGYTPEDVFLWEQEEMQQTEEQNSGSPQPD